VNLSSVVRRLVLWGFLVFAGCSTVGPLPRVDLDDPSWSVRTGQALWKPRSDRPQLAGELIVARHTAGWVFVSFSKPPLPIFTAQTDDASWRIDFVERGRSYSGSGRPPKRFVWFRLPELIDGSAAPPGWGVERPTDDEIVLENPRTGEVIRVVLDR